MESPNLEAIRSFNRELLLIQSMGIPVSFGNALKPQQLDPLLESITARYALQMGRGQSIEQWLANDSEVPQAYRTALDHWLRTGNLSESVDSLTSLYNARTELAYSFSFSLLQPLVLFVLTYFGFIILCFGAVPKFEAMYAQEWQAPSFSLQCLIILRELFPYWGIGVPLLFVLALFYWLKQSYRFRFSWLPGTKSFFGFIQKSQYAAQLADLLEHGYSRSAAMSFAGVIPQYQTSNTKRTAATTYLINKAAANEPVSENDPEITVIPSLLRWALTNDISSSDQADSLRFTSRAYQNIAQARQHSWYVWLPVIMTALIGGTLVLIYGLSLFSPMLDLLIHLSQPTGDKP